MNTKPMKSWFDPIYSGNDVFLLFNNNVHGSNQLGFMKLPDMKIVNVEDTFDLLEEKKKTSQID